MPALFPDLNTTWADAAASAYNPHWHQTADAMCNALHQCDVYLRPLWWMNGNLGGGGGGRRRGEGGGGRRRRAESKKGYSVTVWS